MNVFSQIRNRRPHICLIAPNVFPVLSKDRRSAVAGGAEVQQTFIAHGLVLAGYRVTVATFAEAAPNEFELDGVRIIAIRHGGIEIPVIRNVHPRLTRIWQALHQADADIYYQRCAGANTLVAGLFSRKHGRRFVYSGAHDLDYMRDETWKLFRGRGGWRDLQMYQLGLQLADGIVAQHPGQVAACRRWYGREAIEIPNCYAPPQGSVAARDGVILWVATVKSWKRPELFLELARRLPQFRFRMVGGPGPGAEAEVFSQIKEAAATLPNVEFVGFVPFVDVEMHFDAARVFVNTSDYEGFPNTFLQSWARGVPTVSFFDCGAKRDEKPVGSVCKDIAEMAAAVLRLSEDDHLWMQEGERAKAYFESNHSVDMAVTKYSRLFEQLLSSKDAG
jgi:glycosyltransferase involved in cell wall biosynthesis